MMCAASTEDRPVFIPRASHMLLMADNLGLAGVAMVSEAAGPGQRDLQSTVSENLLVPLPIWGGLIRKHHSKSHESGLQTTLQCHYRYALCSVCPLLPSLAHTITVKAQGWGWDVGFSRLQGLGDSPCRGASLGSEGGLPSWLAGSSLLAGSSRALHLLIITLIPGPHNSSIG